MHEPDWLIVDDFVDTDLGTLKTGKEAEIRLVERTSRNGTRRHLLVDKRYRPKTVTYKGELEELGFARAATFRNDAGVPVPYPVGTDRDSSVLQQYLGDDEGAAPRLAQARLGPTDLSRAWHQLLDALRAMTASGWVHADLSAYNLLWWEDRLWVIDVPQAVDLHAATNGYALLHRDVANVCAWFARKGVEHDPDEVFASIL